MRLVAFRTGSVAGSPPQKAVIANDQIVDAGDETLSVLDMVIPLVAYSILFYCIAQGVSALFENDQIKRGRWH